MIELNTPKEWEFTELSNIVNIVRGVTYNKNDAIFESKKGYLPIIRANNIQNGRIIFEDLIYVPEHLVTELQKTRKQDLVIAMSSGSRNVVGKSAHIDCDWKGSFGAFCGLLRPSEIVSKKFLYWFTCSNIYRNKISELAAGVNINNLKHSHFSEINIPIPALAEQKEIASRLDNLLAQVDSIKARLEKISGIVKRFRKSIFEQACNGQLTSEWRKTNLNVESCEGILLQLHKNRITCTGKKKNISSPVIIFNKDLPAKWIITRIMDYCDCLDNLRKPVNRESREKACGDIPYYGANGQVGWINGYIFDEELVLVVEDETFTGREKPFSYIIRGKSWVNNHAHVLKPTSGINVKFLNIQLSYFNFIPLTTGTTGRRKLNQETLTNINVSLPPLIEQSEIIKRVEKYISIADSVELKCKKTLQQVELFTQSILSKAFSGELTAEWREQHPELINGENSAEELLKRIKTERNADSNNKKIRKPAKQLKR